MFGNREIGRITKTMMEICPKTSVIRLLREPFADEVIYRIRRKSEHVCERRAAS